MGWKICEPVCYSLSLLEEEDKAMLEGKWSDYKFYEWVTFSVQAALVQCNLYTESRLFKKNLIISLFF